MKYFLAQIICITLLLSGCASNQLQPRGYTAEVKAGFEGSENLYVGVSRWPQDPVTLNIWAQEDLQQKCSGVFSKGLVMDDGIIHNGGFSFTCTDGRRVTGDWYSPSGQNNLIGEGSDENGVAFHIIAGTQLTRFPEIEAKLLKKIGFSAKNGTAKVESEKPKSISTGTGFFISNDGYMLTNSHVIEGSSNISVILNGKSVPAALIEHDSRNDIALLKVNESVKGLPIELKKNTKQGAEIAILGYPNIGLQGNEQKANFGYINSNSGIQGDTRYFQIDSPIQPGNSGSPMVNKNGVVIGIASATLNQSAAIRSTGTLAQNVNYAVKITYALPMLISHGVKYIEISNQKPLVKTDLIESIAGSVVLVVAE